MGLWEFPAKEYKIRQSAEDDIVRRFAGTLEDLVGSKHITYEGTKKRGRCDLLIHEPAMTSGVGPCVLEFKVLREQNSHSYHRKWVLKGVLQARDYSIDNEANSRYLMTYDARKNEKDIEYVDALADKYEVRYMRFRMYNTTSAEREQEVTEIVKNKGINK